MSYEALGWMLEELADHEKTNSKTLRFQDSYQENVRKNSDVFDKMYDSRSGVAAYYRYKPRDVGRFCKDNNIAVADVHDSVFARIAQKGRGYHPGNLPTNDISLRSVPESSSIAGNANEKKAERARENSNASFWIRTRSALYLSMVLLTLLVVTVILDEIVPNAVAFLGCVLLVVVVIFVTEWLSQRWVHARVPIYLVGVAAAAGLVWYLWSEIPHFEFEKYTFPALILLITARIGYRQVTKPQHLVGTTEERHYRRWESAFVCLIGCVVTFWLYATILFQNQSDNTVGPGFVGILQKTVGLVVSVLPEAAEQSVETAIRNYPYWSLAALIAGLLIVLGMNLCKKKASRYFNAGWDVVRD
jgi:hypothetical protein